MRGCSRAAVRPTTPLTSDNRREPRRLWRGGCFPGGAGAGLEQVGAAHLETTAPVEAMGPHSEATPTPHHTGHLSERACSPAAETAKLGRNRSRRPRGIRESPFARALTRHSAAHAHQNHDICSSPYRLQDHTGARFHSAPQDHTLSVIHVHQC